MDNPNFSDFDTELARRLQDLRRERGWSLDQLAHESGVSRATLSRLEKAEVSGTTQALGRLCGAYGMTMSRLMQMVEDGFEALVPVDKQAEWTDPETGFVRRSVSPPSRDLSGEVIESRLKPGTRIKYDRAPRAGLEHHVVLLEGQLYVQTGEQRFELNKPGDCLRFHLSESTIYETPAESGARYMIFLA